MKKKTCEHCGEVFGSAGKVGIVVARGVFEGCWTCSRKCHKALLSACSDNNEAREERRQLGLTAE